MKQGNFSNRTSGPRSFREKKNSQKGSKQFKLQEENEIPPNIPTFVYVFIL